MKSVLGAILASLALILSPSAISAVDTYTFAYNAMAFTLTHQPCVDKVILEITKDVKLNDGSKPVWYAGKVVYPGNVPYEMCYIVNPLNTLQLYVIDTDGDGGLIERPAPKPEGV
jgi:hypothetical protein